MEVMAMDWLEILQHVTALRLPSDRDRGRFCANFFNMTPAFFNIVLASRMTSFGA